MASLSSLHSISTASSKTLSACPTRSPQKKTQKYNHLSVIQCKSRDQDNHGNETSSTSFIDRRDLLIGLGGIYGATTSGFGKDRMPAIAAPITIPDLSNCSPADLPPGVTGINCCPPPTTKIIDFELPSYSTLLRVRPAAHLVDEAYIAKINKAYALMRALPDDDPRSLKNQSNLHCAYCDAAFNQTLAGFPNLEIQVHSSWLFYPFHRYFLYFHEKILGTLLDYNYNLVDSNLPAQQLITSNLTTMYRQVVSGGKTPTLFLGSPYRAGDPPAPGAGTLESLPHNIIHGWTGDRTQPNIEDMGSSYVSARDQSFSLIIRMLTAFGLYGRVKDCLEHENLGYKYQDVEIPWLQAKPKAPTGKKVDKNAVGKTEYPITLDKTVQVLQERKEDKEEMLIISGIELNRCARVRFDVFINYDGEVGTDSCGCAGSFTNLPHAHGDKDGNGEKLKTPLKLALTDILEDLDAEDDEYIVVTMVPRESTENGMEQVVTIDDIQIQFD
ncbi:hypothetical protein MKW92_013429 [Papaver armeniacum]|nr:hypothetical protein MKW92_013429 [Papaver armeniacum]